MRPTRHARSRRAVIPDALEVAGNRGQVIGQTWMCHAVVMRGHSIAARQLVQVRGIGDIAKNIVKAVILHHDDDNMLPLPAGLGGGGRCGALLWGRLLQRGGTYQRGCTLLLCQCVPAAREDDEQGQGCYDQVTGM